MEPPGGDSLARMGGSVFVAVPVFHGMGAGRRKGCRVRRVVPCSGLFPCFMGCVPVGARGAGCGGWFRVRGCSRVSKGVARVPAVGVVAACGVPGSGVACRAAGSRAGRLCCSLFGGGFLSQEGVPCSGLFPCFAVRPAPFPPSAPRPFRRPPRYHPPPPRRPPRHTRSHARAPLGFLRVRSGSLSSFRTRHPKRRPAHTPGGSVFGAVPFLLSAPGTPSASRHPSLGGSCSGLFPFFFPRQAVPSRWFHFFRPGSGVFRPGSGVFRPGSGFSSLGAFSFVPGRVSFVPVLRAGVLCCLFVCSVWSRRAAPVKYYGG